ncbi:unnamed protein product [Haemonchus placei]|uniref:NR LBD domain-containing protein n=1 Tax=Haemonchus placei TaxID=6290 RepID=A0A0N4W487_HAEPC|nr:unnamed protein product [Haemonchus placei]
MSKAITIYMTRRFLVFELQECTQRPGESNTAFLQRIVLEKLESELSRTVELADSLKTTSLGFLKWQKEHPMHKEQSLPGFDDLDDVQDMLLVFGTVVILRQGWRTNRVSVRSYFLRIFAFDVSHICINREPSFKDEHGSELVSTLFQAFSLHNQFGHI